MKEDNVYVGEYDEKKSSAWKTSVKAGAFTGTVSGAIYAICFSVSILIHEMRTLPPVYWQDFYFYAPFLLMILTLIGVAVGALFGFGFMAARRRKVQFYKHLVRDWTAAWTILICITFTLVTGINTFWALPTMLLTFCLSLIASLIGGYVGVPTDIVITPKHTV